MERKIDALVASALSGDEELELCKELQSFVMQPVPHNQNERVQWINANIKLLLFVSKRRGSVPGLKKSASNIDSFRAIEPLCMAFMAKSKNTSSALAVLEILSSARHELNAEPNGRLYCSCTLAMNWFRNNNSMLDDSDVSIKASAYLVDGLCDFWSEIRSSFVKFVEQLVQSCGPKLAEHLLNGVFDVCSHKESPWQSVEGCLAAICCIVEGLGFSPNKSREHEMIMSTIHQRLLAVVWPHITHSQIGVRESAVRAVTVHLVRADSAETAHCLDRLFKQLQAKEDIPEEIEGHFTACIEILKLLNSDAINAQQHDWIRIILDYLTHSATTVRLIAGSLAKTLVGKHANSSAFLHTMLACIILPLETKANSSWQESEGRVMAIDAILRVTVANHWLYNFTSSTYGPSPFSTSAPAKSQDDYLPMQGRKTLEANADVAAEMIQLSKTQRKYANKTRCSFLETRKASVSFEFLDNMKPISLLDLCVQNKSETEASTGKNPPLSSLLKTALFSAAKMLDADQWELRRVAAQVIPYIGEAIRWYDMDLFWQCIETLMEPKSDVGTSAVGRSPNEMAASLILAAWLQQADRICIQIEDGRLIASSRLKDYIFATKGMFRFVEKLLSFCKPDSLDRQTVTSTRVLLQFLARTNLGDLAMSGSLRHYSIQTLLHDVMRMGVSLVWFAINPQQLIKDAALLAQLYNIPEKKDSTATSRPFLLFGSVQLQAAASQSTSVTGARICIIEQILPEIVALLRHFSQNQSSMVAEEVLKIPANENPQENVFLLVGSLLTPLAYLLALYSFDTDLLPYITDSISVIALGLLNCRTEFLFEGAIFEIECFLEQLYFNIINALASGERTHTTAKDNNFSVYAAARIAFWGCRLILKHCDNSFFCESVQITAKLANIVALVSRRILSLVPNESSSKAASSIEVDASEIVPSSAKAAWNVVGCGEILRPTPVPPHVLSAPPETTGHISHQMSQESDDENDSFDDFEASEGEDDIDYEDMVMDDDLDELLVEVVTDMRSIIPQFIREPAVSSFFDEKERNLLAYLLL